MSESHEITISQLQPNDAHALAPLIAAYAQTLKRGAPRFPGSGKRVFEAMAQPSDGHCYVLRFHK